MNSNVRLSASHVSRHVYRIQVAFLAREHNQGGANLNGDGDALDLVLHLFDASTSASVNLGLATQAGTDPVKVDGGRALLLAWEPDQGADLNADGDALDAVVHVARFPD